MGGEQAAVPSWRLAGPQAQDKPQTFIMSYGLDHFKDIKMIGVFKSKLFGMEKNNELRYTELAILRSVFNANKYPRLLTKKKNDGLLEWKIMPPTVLVFIRTIF